MKTTKRFRVLTPEEYERLTPARKLAYIDDAFRAKRLGRAKKMRSAKRRAR